MSKKINNVTYAWVIKQTDPKQLQELAPNQPASMCYVDHYNGYNQIANAYFWETRELARNGLSEKGEKTIRVRLTVEEV